MIDPSSSARRQALVGNAQGLHLRVAHQFVCLAQRYASEIRVRCDGAEAHGKSILDLMCLAARSGMVLELEASGPDAEEAVAALADLLSTPSPEAEEYRAT